jgi:NADH:ubiquinone oxidoreductase subunit 4 (subunit M)
MLAMAFFGPPRDDDPHVTHLHDASPRELTAASILACAIVFVGIYPAPFMHVINSGVKTLLTGMGVGS